MNSPLHVKNPLSMWSLRNRLILATLSLAAVAILASDFAANTALRSFLVNQVDAQLNSIAGGSLLRLDRAGIDDITSSSATADENSPYKVLKPLRGVPTATTVTLLDTSGKIVGHLGGDLIDTTSSNAFAGFTPVDVITYAGKPFTFISKKDQPDIRAIAKLLPSGLGTVVVSVSLDSVDRTLKELKVLFLIISLLVLLLIGIVSRWIIALSLNPLDKVEITAEAIAAGDLSARLPDANPDTEVGRLTASLNRMLARIEESFAIRVASESKLRRFVADASHELRTPLTAIRGFAELHRQGAVQGEEKTKELIQRIEKESIRMGSLVEDLLLLARLDQSRELAQEPVDLNWLIPEVVASARAAGPDHPITLHLPGEETYVLGDTLRIHQALANLLANARTHTPAGTKISVSVTQSENETTVDVSDTGPGLSAEDQERIFERFYRADPSRVRTMGEGTGLGLSIVSAVMGAQGGSVTVTSTPNEGATFTLHFPIQD
ncbi:MAG: HAMP domain-containing sensor histidine kinase [Actinomycetes bacterium]